MQASRGESGRLRCFLVVVVTLGLVLPVAARPQDVDLLSVRTLPSVEVAGTGQKAVVGWPNLEGQVVRFGRTEAWLTAKNRISWYCGRRSLAETLVVSTKAGPSKREQRIDLGKRQLGGGQNDVELYLWSHEAIREACAGGAKTATVQSEVVLLDLFCEDPEVMVPRREKRLPLRVDCLPEADPASHFDRKSWHQTIDQKHLIVEPHELKAGKKRGVTVTFRQPLRSFSPRPVKLEIVRVDKKGENPRPIKTCFDLPSPPEKEVEPCVARLSLKLAAGRAAHFALQGTWADGSQQRSEPKAIRAPTAAELANRLSPKQRTVVFERAQKVIDAHDCGEDLAKALKRVKGIKDAGVSPSGDVWWHFRDGLMVGVHCHPDEDGR